jgi:hypothetical protein
MLIPLVLFMLATSFAQSLRGTDLISVLTLGQTDWIVIWGPSETICDGEPRLDNEQFGCLTWVEAKSSSCKPDVNGTPTIPEHGSILSILNVENPHGFEKFGCSEVNVCTARIAELNNSTSTGAPTGNPTGAPTSANTKTNPNPSDKPKKNVPTDPPTNPPTNAPTVHVEVKGGGVFGVDTVVFSTATAGLFVLCVGVYYLYGKRKQQYMEFLDQEEQQKVDADE